MNYKLVLIVLITFFVFISGCIIESDSDGDGYSNKVDNFPNNANFHSDLDGDGYADEIDAFPNDASYHSDLDGDGYADEIDAFPDDANYHSNDENKIDWQQGCYYYSPENIFICNNYQATKEFIKSISSDQLEGIDVVGIAHTTGNYVLLYAIPELGEQVPSFAIYDPSDNTTNDIGYEKDVERLGITITSYEIIMKVDSPSNVTQKTSDISESTTTKESIILKGSDTLLPLSQAEAEDFMVKNQNSDITVIGGGSGVGISAFIDGEAEIAMASRTMKDSEKEIAINNGINPVETIIGWDGIAVIVNPENPVTQLTFTQLKAIYDGSISNWKDVGGEDGQITVISRDSSSGTYEYFKEKVLEGREYRQDSLVEPATGAIVQEVAQNKGAIGYIGYAYLDESTKALALDGGEDNFVSATEEKILSGEYPLARQLYYYTNGEPQGLTKEFIDYVMSEEGQTIVSDVGYFPVK